MERFSECILKLREEYYKCGLIPVVGSGISVPMGLPDWKTLLLQINEQGHLGKEAQIRERTDRYDYLGAADVLLKAGMSELELQFQTARILLEAKEKQKKKEKGEHNYLDLGKMGRARFLTTNYDAYLNDFVKGRVMHLEELGSIEVNGLRQKKYDRLILPLHGEISRPQSIILTKKAYEKLYGTKVGEGARESFAGQFELLRHGFTFLFMGFSFDDVYFEEMFRRLTEKGFPARHFILFDKAEQKKNEAKLVRLENNYHVTPVFYDAQKDGHVGGIRKILSRIMEFRDDEIDLSGLQIVKAETEEKKKSRLEKQLLKASQLLQEQQVGKAGAIYRKLWSRQTKERYSVKEQLSILQGLECCSGILRENEAAKEYADRIEELCGQQEASFEADMNRAQLLLNLYDFSGAVKLLEEWKEKVLTAHLLYDIAKQMAAYLPARPLDGGSIPVYGEKPWDANKKKSMEQAYELLKGRYVNPLTYNLKAFDSYASRFEQHRAYYYLSIAAGQIFHQHRDAIAYLYRSFEIQKTVAVYEELGHNYLAAAMERVRYKADAELADLDMDGLMKAKECFEMALLRGDRLYRQSVYQHSGLAYLRVLSYLRLDYLFCRTYKKVQKYANLGPDQKPDQRAYEEFCDLVCEVEARYHGRLLRSMLSVLNEERKGHVMVTYYMARAGQYEQMHRTDMAEKYWKSCVRYIRSVPEYRAEKRLLQGLLDSLFFLGKREEFEVYQKDYEKRHGKEPVYQAFAAELSGDGKKALRQYRWMFEQNPGIVTFTFLRNFLKRQKRAEAVYALYGEVWEHYREIVYDCADFWHSYIFMAVQEKDMDRALAIYGEGWQQITNLEMRMEVEKVLRPVACDFSNAAERIAYIRGLLRDAPKVVWNTLYQDMLFLFMANMQLKEAGELLLEMQEKEIFADPASYRMYSILQEPQMPGMYMPGISRNVLVEEMLPDMIRLYAFAPVALEEARRDGVERIILPSALLWVITALGQWYRLQAFEKVYVAYSGFSRLQYSLFHKECRTIRETVGYICREARAETAAPSLAGYCACKKEHPGWDTEQIQIRRFCEENDVREIRGTGNGD